MLNISGKQEKHTNIFARVAYWKRPHGKPKTVWKNSYDLIDIAGFFLILYMTWADLPLRERTIVTA